MRISASLFGFTLTLRVERSGVSDILLYDPFLRQVITNTMNILLSSPTKQKTITATPVNSDGSPVTVVGSITYAVSTPGIVSLFANDNGTSFDLEGIGPGTTDITVKYTAKSGAVVTKTITVTVGPAVVVVPDPQEAVDILFVEGPETEQIVATIPGK